VISRLNDRSRQIRSTLAVAALLLAGACDQGDVDLAEQAATAPRQIVSQLYVNKDGQFFTSRFKKVVCGTKCVAWSTKKVRKLNPKTHMDYWTTESTCTASGEDCENNVAAVELHATKSAAQSGADPFRAYVQPSGWQYLGCGPQAVQNFTNYIGTPQTIQETAANTSTYSLGFLPDFIKNRLPDDIATGVATTPDDLADSLGWHTRSSESNYYWHANGGASLDQVKVELMKGWPVVLLVLNGWHYQMVTGFRAPDLYYVIDYAGNEGNHSGWTHARDLGYDSLEGAPSYVPFGFGGYNASTMLTVSAVLNPGNSSGGDTGSGDGG
jgi:hypothetical protein